MEDMFEIDLSSYKEPNLEVKVQDDFKVNFDFPDLKIEKGKI